jgi:hypothetical protein
MTEIIGIIVLIFFSIIFLIDVIFMFNDKKKSDERLVAELAKHTINIIDLEIHVETLSNKCKELATEITHLKNKEKNDDK